MLLVMSKMKVVDLIYFPFDLFSIFLFLELRVRVRAIRSCSHIRWYSHKSRDIWKDIKDSGKMMLYNMCNICWL